MKLTNPDTRSLLAAEYVLGTLHGRARARFELWLRSDPALRREVSQWQSRLEPLAAHLPEVTPSDAVWRNIEARIQPRPTRLTAAPSPAWWSSLAFWRWSSFSTAALAFALLGYIFTAPGDQVPNPADSMVVVMADETTSPKMTIAWVPEGIAKPRLRIRVIGHQEMAPDTTWELWMLPGRNQPPRSLGLINTHETQFVELPREVLDLLNRADGMAMSVEPRGGSPTGRPTGPVLYSGKCVKI
ncbi:MAG: anti-sigma factor [Burkholderiales bacterium]